MKYGLGDGIPPCPPSRPARGAWVEMYISIIIAKTPTKSRPARGAWVEIYTDASSTYLNTSSRPARGAWVEICDGDYWELEAYVAPRKGRVG